MGWWLTEAAEQLLGLVKRAPCYAAPAGEPCAVHACGRLATHLHRDPHEVPLCSEHAALSHALTQARYGVAA